MILEGTGSSEPQQINHHLVFAQQVARTCNRLFVEDDFDFITSRNNRKQTFPVLPNTHQRATVEQTLQNGRVDVSLSFSENGNRAITYHIQYDDQEWQPTIITKTENNMSRNINPITDKQDAAQILKTLSEQAKLINERGTIREADGNQHVTNIVVGAIPKKEKIDVGNGPVNTSELPEAIVLQGGQDVAGVHVSSHLVILTAADGVSEGNKEDSATAARIAAVTALNEAYQLSMSVMNDVYTRRLADALENILRTAHTAIKPRVTDGTTTAIVAIIRKEPDGNLYLNAAYCGDTQLTIFRKNKQGETVLQRILLPADALDAYMRREGINVDALSFEEAKEARQKALRNYATKKGKSVKNAEEELGPIVAFLGGRDTAVQPHYVSINLNDFPGSTDIKVMVSSDYAGEKMSEQELITLYETYPDNADFGRALIQQMRKSDLDDGCFVLASVAA